MKVDFLLDNECALPIYVISVRLAATIYAYELGRWNDTDFTEAEIKPFLLPERDITRRTHAWESIPLAGNPRRARDAIESLICRDIDAGRLSAVQVRRDLDGALLTDETLLDIDKIRKWGETYELGHGDWWSEYLHDEVEIASQALSAIQEGWDRLQNPEALEHRKERARAMDEDAILEILRENERLRALANTPNERPLDGRTRASLLCIIGALADAAKIDLSKPMKAGETIAAMMPDVKLSWRAIGEHLKDVRNAMDSRKG